MSNRYVGVDVGAETIKVVELVGSGGEGGRLSWVRRQIVAHDKEPGVCLLAVLHGWGWDGVDGAAVSGRLSRQVNLPRIPSKQAQAGALRYLFGAEPATVVSIGNHGFSVLELRQNGVDVFRENGRCSQGTGNFLRQLIERFDLTIEEASAMCADVADPAPLSGRCPVILKTDMTHLANKGEDRARILAGLYDAVCENVQVLIKPRISPPRVALIGGVARSRRIRDHFARFLARHDMQLLAGDGDDALYFEALGCALAAADRPAWVPALDRLLLPPPSSHFDKLPPLADYRHLVKRMPPQRLGAIDGAPRGLILGFDIGSTGSKTVAMDARTREVVWEGYLRTSGNPVAAAQGLMQQFTASPAGRCRVIAVGVTGSGREIVGSLMATCYGGDAVFVLNEIAAHAEGALEFDPRVDTIFEIGGQDAKYIRLAGGRVVDAAMNEACSAGTGSFIEEQGRKFADVGDVVQLGREALAADGGVSLGQHCSVFMAEIIDEAVGGGVDQQQIIAGIYDSIIQNYLNRVKGSRSVGQVIFCQGMPFAADALAAAVARQTGSQVIVPPNPGTVGALGIALLTMKQLPGEAHAADAGVDPARFLAARVERKDTFVCKAVEGCGGAGNKCRIDRIATVVEEQRKRFTWGGGCSLWDKGTRKHKLPDRAPDPFRERQELTDAIIARVSVPRGRLRVGVADEFQLKGMFPFFATYLYELGFDVLVHSGADHGALKRGIEQANVPFCAPMQQYHGLIATLAEARPDFIFLPMLRCLPKVAGERNAVVCPIVQGAPDVLKLDLASALHSKVVSPVIDLGLGNFQSAELWDSCLRLAAELGVVDTPRAQAAFRAAGACQARFDDGCLELGRQALAYCGEQGVTPVVVLGRSYTIYNTVLNSNVPAILREQGAMAIPVDCYPVGADVPLFEDVFWGHGHRNLRAAHQIRRTPGIYSLYCSNYSCGPDSFNLHFYAYIMDGKPFSVIETDGHAGDAGTKTRVEAFLHCVRQDLAATPVAQRPANSFKRIELDKRALPDIQRRDELVLIPRMGPGAEVLAATLRGVGVRAEALPLPDRETVRIGRRHTSGKECVPMIITAGGLLQRIERDRASDEHFAFFMPKAGGPCRFGVYNLLHKIILERLGWKDRVRIWSPASSGYFDGVAPGFATLTFAGFVAADLLLEALYWTRPIERRAGLAREIYDRAQRELLALLEREAHGDLSTPTVLLQVASGRLFGVMDLLRRAGGELAAAMLDKQLPTVLVVGEIYVRCDPFANDFIIDKLEQRGIRGRFAAFTEWLEYLDHINLREGNKGGFGAHLADFVRGRMQSMTYGVMAERLGWPPRTTVDESLRAAGSYVRADLVGEAVLTVGGPLHEWREGLIDGVVSVGPLECMPNKLAEAHFFHVAERESLLSLTLPLNGDPVDPEVVDNFAFEVHARWRKRLGEPRARPAAAPPSLRERSRRVLRVLGQLRGPEQERSP